MPDIGTETSPQTKTPDYAGLVSFLVKPFLEVPEALSIDCEVSRSKAKVWVRLAFEGSDKGRVFGRGGRNIQAIRTVLEGVARSVGYTAYLDVFGSLSQGRNDDSDHESTEKPSPRRSSGSKGHPKPRSRDVPS